MNKKSILIFLGFIATLIFFSKLSYIYYVEATKNNENIFEGSIADFEELDRANFPEPNGIIFLGSSTFSLWGTLV